MEKDLALLSAKLAAPVVAKLLEPLVDFFKRSGSEYTSSVKAVLASFDEYVSRMNGRHGIFHSFVFPHNGKLLRDFYEPLYISQFEHAGRVKKPVYRVDRFPGDIFEVSPRVLIVDSAGMGKSTLLKYIFLSLLDSKEKVPLFVELRKLNGGISIKSFIIDEINGGGKVVDEGVLLSLLASGSLAVFLDGFDEVSASDKARVAADITNLISHYPKNYYIVSSRDEPGLVNLFGFRRYGIEKLNNGQAESLINRLSPTEEQAKVLCSKLNRREGASLKEFLTSPLLVSLLVKSFVYTPILPVRLSEFYRQVFDALYQTHDASKELCGFARAKESALDLDSFHRVLRALGILTYIDGIVEYSKDDLIRYLKSAQDLCGDKGFKPSDFCADLLKAVPLFVQEGASMRWAHKSLQEYFAAAYICFDSKEKEEDLLSQIYERGSYSKDKGLLDFCCDIDSKSFKKYVVKRLLSDLQDVVSGRCRGGVEWLDPLDRNDRLSCTLLKEVRFLVRSRATKGVSAVMEKYRPSVVSELVGSGARRIEIKIPFFFDKSMHPVFDDATPIKYVAEFLLDQKYILLILAAERLGYQKLVKYKPRLRQKWGFANVPVEEFFLVNDDPRSPLNAGEAFHGVQLALDRIPIAIINAMEIPDVLEQLTSEESVGNKISLKFH